MPHTTPSSLPAIDVVAAILEHNAGRHAGLLARKYARLRVSPFVFLRGTCHLFVERLDLGGSLALGPPAWSSGDLHLENFGSYQGDNRLAYFDINDFDEAALAPAGVDLLRLLASLLLASSQLDLSRKQAASLCELCVGGYAGALAQGKPQWVERDTARGLIAKLLGSVQQRRHDTLLAQHTTTVDKRLRIRCDADKALAMPAHEQAPVIELLESTHTMRDTRPFKVLDVARHGAGTASLGIERYLVLVRRINKRDDGKLRLLDLKQAQPSSLAGRLAALQPVWASQAQRQVEVQQRMQAVVMARLHAVVSGRGSYVLRTLQPTEDRIDMAAPGLALADVRDAVVTMARMLAWAQLRSSGRQGSASADHLIDFGRAAPDWQGELMQAAQQAAAQVKADWKVWRRAYDSGALAT